MIFSRKSKKYYFIYAKVGSFYKSIDIAARSIILQDGVTSVTARAVAELTGCSYATIYHYFKDLNELLLKTKPFTKFTAYMGIALNIGIIQIFVFLIPQFGEIFTLTNLVSTFIRTIWNILVAKLLFQIARDAKKDVSI